MSPTDTDGLDRVILRLPWAWLDETPLVRRLAELVPHQPAPARGLLRRWFR